MRPLSVGELLDAAFSSVRRNLRGLMVCVLAVITPVAILQTLALASVTNHAFDFTQETTIDVDNAGTRIAALAVTYLLLAIGQMIAPAACLRIIGGEIVNSPATAGESLRFGLQRIGPLALVILLYVLAILAGLVLCLVGAIWTYYLFALALPALLFEDARGTQAMRRSRDLVSGTWWRTAGTLFMMALIAGIVRAVLTGALQGIILVNSSNEVVNAVLITVATVVGYTIALPLQAAVTAYVYFDLRVRKEGFDLAMLAQRIGAPAPTPTHTESGCLRPTRRRRAASCRRNHRRRRRSRRRVLDAARAREQARAILGERRYHDSHVPRPFKGVLHWLGQRLTDVGHAIAGLPGPAWLGWLILALIVGVAVLLARGLIRRRAAPAYARRTAVAAAAVDPAELERAAAAAERDGDWESAVRLRFRAGVVRLDLPDALTTGAISASLASPEFDALGADFDAIAYGGRDAVERDARRARDGWRAVAP